MKLKVKFLKWSAGVPVAMLNEKTANRLGARAKERIAIETISDNPQKIFTILDTARDSLVKEGEILVSSELKERLNLKTKQEVDVGIASIPKSVIYIQKKLNKKPLSQKEISSIIRDITNNALSEVEISLFVSAMYKNGMTMKETIYLINSILKSGNKLNLKEKIIVDKHSIGGIPGNRTTPLVVSICAAAGLTFPMTSSRAITSAAGTADVIETVAKIEFSIKDLEKVMKKANACLVWGGGLGFVPADSKIIHVEKILKIDPEAQLLASIISKKLAVGSNHILIDIPYGAGAKVNKAQALNLKKKFEALGRHFKRKLKCVLTDGTEPIGNGIGPALELKDIISILDPEKQGPRDLEDKSLFLSGQILEMAGKADKGKGVQMAMELLDSGKAFKKFNQIIKAQGGDLNRIKTAKYQYNVLVKKSGKIISINNKSINILARVAGCPSDKASGLYLHHHVGEELRKKQKILTIYSESKSRLKEAIKFLKESKPIEIK